MYGLRELKEKIKTNENSVECPVRNCKTVVGRRTRKSTEFDSFYCQIHDIYLTPTTFLYRDINQNLLWANKNDTDLFREICENKRKVESFNHDNSEDAVTWNVFRYLENQSLFSNFLSSIAGYNVKNPETIFWLYCKSEEHVWSRLIDARTAFETNPKKGSEPDIIVLAENALFFIEAKLTATNETTPSSSKLQEVQKKYESGANNWYSNVFASSFQRVAVEDKKYELLRFWLLGSWIASNLKTNFFLINLVPSKRESDIEVAFRKHIIEDHTANQKRAFLRITWEDIYNFILSTDKDCLEKRRILSYLKNKTVGYNNKGILQKAFSTE